MTNALSAFRHLWRRPDQLQWSRLERDLPGSALPTHALDLDHESTAADSSEMRHYLAAQTSQVV